jgi:hypothetical protein
MWVVGDNNRGQLGDGRRTETAQEPQLVTAISSRCVVLVGVGDEFSVCICADGHAFSFGCGSGGSLGHGNTCDQLYPKLIEWFSDHGIRLLSIIASGNMISATSYTGEVYAWGISRHGSLGHHSWSNIAGHAANDIPTPCSQCSLVPELILAIELTPKPNQDTDDPNYFSNWTVTGRNKDLKSKLSQDLQHYYNPSGYYPVPLTQILPYDQAPFSQLLD